MMQQSPKSKPFLVRDVQTHQNKPENNTIPTPSIHGILLRFITVNNEPVFASDTISIHDNQVTRPNLS